MKTFIIASSVALAALSAPQIALANNGANSGSERGSETVRTSEIVVTAEHQRNWDRGNRIEAEGLSDLQRAQRDLVRHSADVVIAQDKRDTSLSRALNARQAFENLIARPFFTAGADAKDWAKQVEDAASDWDRFEDRSEEGAREFERAQRRQLDAQESVNEAQAQVDEGRAMKSDAERASQRSAQR